MDAHDDVSDEKNTAKEDVQIRSRWNAQGEGRADITLSGGDVPQTYGTVSAIECWDSSFARVYYGDSVEYAPTEGDVAACAYSEPLSEWIETAGRVTRVARARSVCYVAADAPT